MDLEMKTKKEGSTFSVELNGELNTLTAPELKALLDDNLRDTDLLILDFSGCDYVSSAGLRVLLNTFKVLTARNGQMKLQNIGPNLADLLKLTELDVVFNI